MPLMLSIQHSAGNTPPGRMPISKPGSQSTVSSQYRTVKRLEIDTDALVQSSALVNKKGAIFQPLFYSQNLSILN